ncbi:MAG: hypothetical protein K0S39_125 [Paenibacillus sp.]|jgi:hypothetical protein|nr:hypothetical protein [Paenibacillus sp.]
MAVEWIWSGISLMTVLILLWRFVDWSDIRRVWVSFLIMQLITWSVGSLLVKYRLTEYPVRWFPDATRQNFMSGYLIYPCLCIVYIQCYPPNNRLKQMAYTAGYAAAAAGWDYVTAAYTELANHVNWNPVYQFFLVGTALVFCRWFVTWMFKADFAERSANDG